MTIRHVEGTHIAVVTLGDETRSDSEIMVGDVSIGLDANGEIVDVEVLDTRQFGEPFDNAAAERAVAWARDQVARRRAAAV